MIGPRSANFPSEYERNIAIKKGMRDLNAVPSLNSTSRTLHSVYWSSTTRWLQHKRGLGHLFREANIVIVNVRALSANRTILPA